jgi:hypothetical protein
MWEEVRRCWCFFLSFFGAKADMGGCSFERLLVLDWGRVFLGVKNRRFFMACKVKQQAVRLAVEALHHQFDPMLHGIYPFSDLHMHSSIFFLAAGMPDIAVQICGVERAWSLRLREIMRSIMLMKLGLRDFIVSTWTRAR